MTSQIHIRNFAGALDWLLVERVLVSAAQRFGMADATIISRDPPAIRCHSQKAGYGFAIGGRVHGNNPGIVDFHPGKQPSEHFLPMVESITSELQRIFGERYHVPQLSEYIEPQETRETLRRALELASRDLRHEHPDA